MVSSGSQFARCAGKPKMLDVINREVEEGARGWDAQQVAGRRIGCQRAGPSILSLRRRTAAWDAQILD